MPRQPCINSKRRAVVQKSSKQPPADAREKHVQHVRVDFLDEFFFHTNPAPD